jgi:hypothetical protein
MAVTRSMRFVQVTVQPFWFTRQDMVATAITQKTYSNYSSSETTKGRSLLTKISTQLKYIKGKYVATLCDVCDGWEVSEPADIFFIPIVIDVESLTVKSTLSEKEKRSLLTRLDQQGNKNIAEQLSYGNSKYPAYVSTVKKQIKDLLRNK